MRVAHSRLPNDHDGHRRQSIADCESCSDLISMWSTPDHALGPLPPRMASCLRFLISFQLMPPDGMSFGLEPPLLLPGLLPLLSDFLSVLVAPGADFAAPAAELPPPAADVSCASAGASAFAVSLETGAAHPAGINMSWALLNFDWR